MEDVHHSFLRTQGDISKLGFGVLERQNKKQSKAIQARQGEAANCHIWEVETVKLLGICD